MQDSEQRWRRLGATGGAVIVTFLLATGTLLTWTDYAFSDSGEFSRRAVAVLDSAAVRHEIAEEIADSLVQATPEAVAFRSVLIAVAEDVRVRTRANHPHGTSTHTSSWYRTRRSRSPSRATSTATPTGGRPARRSSRSITGSRTTSRRTSTRLAR
jgi:hypothetical protein